MIVARILGGIFLAVNAAIIVAAAIRLSVLWWREDTNA